MKNTYTIDEFLKDAFDLVRKTKSVKTFHWNIEEVYQKGNLLVVNNY